MTFDDCRVLAKGIYNKYTKSQPSTSNIKKSYGITKITRDFKITE